jgi:hypothetical protein
MNERTRYRLELDEDETAALEALGWRQPTAPTTCPDPALLLAVDGDALDPATVGSVREHTLLCDTCRMLAEDLAVVLDAPPTDDERRRIRTRVTASARPASRGRQAVAATILAAAATIAFVLLRRPEAPPAAPAAPVAAVASVRVPTVFLADRPYIQRPEPELTLRGKSAPLPQAEQIARALDSADNGRLQDALNQLTTLTRTNSDSSEAHLAIGALWLRADRPEQAVQELERAQQLAGSRTSEEVEWYLAVALVRSGAVARAARILEPLCGRSSLRGALACAGVAELDRPRRR